MISSKKIYIQSVNYDYDEKQGREKWWRCRDSHV
jgi:hypothetical protein